MASSDSVDMTIYGRGGHRAQPQDTVDPIVIGARSVLALQTIPSTRWLGPAASWGFTSTS
jgi:hippurate hydrolase